MKKLFFVLFSLMLKFSGFAENKPHPPPPPPPPPDNQPQIPQYPANWEMPPLNEVIENNPLLKEFSPKAIELILYYSPIPAPSLKIGFTSRIPDKQKHYNEEYRPAWEELLQQCIKNNPALNILTINGATFVLSEIASTNSIPVLVDIYTQMINENKEINKDHQQKIFNILLCIDAIEAMDAIFSLLDAMEVKLGVDSSALLREKIINDLEQALKKQERFAEYSLERPTAITDEITLKEFELANKKQERFDKYQNINLSERNQAFLKKARGFSRAQKDENKNTE